MCRRARLQQWREKIEAQKEKAFERALVKPDDESAVQDVEDLLKLEHKFMEKMQALSVPPDESTAGADRESREAKVSVPEPPVAEERAVPEPALGAQMYVKLEGRTLPFLWIKDETVDALSRRIEDKEGVCVRRIQVEGHAMQEGEAPHGVAPGGQVQALLGGLPGGTRGGPSSAGRGSTTPAEALHLILCFLPDELWRNAREYDLVFKSEAKLHRRDGTRFKAVLLLKGNGCKDEWIIAFLKRRLRHDDGRWQKRVEHLGSILADCDGGKYDAVWFYHCVRDNDLKYLNGKVALDKAAPSPLARLLNAWNAEIWRVWCVDGRWLKHAEQHAFFKPPAPEV